MKIKVGISNHHIHLKKEDFEILFGVESKLEKYKDLSQKGQFSTNNKVTLVGPKGQIENVRVLGPFRNYTQVEISKTDSYILGLNPPVRNSGDIFGSEKITIIGPNGKLDLKEGCILANRHIHLTKKDVEVLGLNGLKKVSIKTFGEKSSILENVFLKVDDSFCLECHLDTDDGNACLLKTGDEIEIIK